MVRIEVGRPDGPPQVIEAHHGILTLNSAYFEKALDSQFVEASARTIKLTEYDYQTVACFVYWCYTRRVMPDDNGQMPPYRRLARLWVFADAFLVPLLQDQCCDLILRRMGESWRAPRPSTINWIYEHTQAGSKLRKCLITCIGKISSADEYFSFSEFNQEVLVDLLRISWNPEYKKHSRQEFMAWDPCQFHVHEPSEICQNKEWNDGSSIILNLHEILGGSGHDW